LELIDNAEPTVFTAKIQCILGFAKPSVEAHIEKKKTCI
jgi:hypothetical protein